MSCVHSTPGQGRSWGRGTVVCDPWVPTIPRVPLKCVRYYGGKIRLRSTKTLCRAGSGVAHSGGGLCTLADMHIIMDCIYVKVHAVVHGKHVILSTSQKQVSTRRYDPWLDCTIHLADPQCAQRCMAYRDEKYSQRTRMWTESLFYALILFKSL